MLNRCHRSFISSRVFARSGLRLIAVAITLLLFFQTSCFLFKKKKAAPAVSLASVRMAFLPFNVPEGNKDLQWTSMAAMALMVKASELNRDLVIVPLWEAMPEAIESAGASRILTPESAVSTASWLSAEWVVFGDITPSKKAVNLSIDFLPVRSNQIPFRYMKTRKVDMLGPCFPEAFRQFLRYMMVKLPEPKMIESKKIMLYKSLAEAVDREYGWFTEADPGKAKEIVSELALADKRLARFLFDPSVYPELAKTE